MPPAAPPSPEPAAKPGFAWLPFLGGAFGPWTVLPLFLVGGWARTGARAFVGLLVVLLLAGVFVGVKRRSWAFLLGLLAGVGFVAIAAAIKLRA